MINVISMKDFLNDGTLPTHFLGLIENYYKNPAELFARVTAVNNKVFYNTGDGTIKGYLLFTDDENKIAVNGTSYRCIYNGFGIVDPVFKEQRAYNELLAFSNDYYNNRYAEPSILYAMTSNAVALKIYYSTIGNIRPTVEGSASLEEKAIAHALKDKLYIKTSANGNPFTIKTELPQRYRDDYLSELSSTKCPEAALLRSLAINGLAGDRLLFFWMTTPINTPVSVDKL